ncbi:MAG: AAA family ATPase [Xanthobacteraceae bacterium]|nr:AAA family ATPase [Xanthobacteraceae bacterium]MBV9631516.1 AAA family ATPase [Xanthobacteraceae bacterium]
MSTPQPAPTSFLKPASDLKVRPTTWLWPARIPNAKLTLLAGAPGSGKSALAINIIAAVTTGGTYPCREGSAPKGSVILVSPHGDPDVLVPRLKAAGADLSRVQILRDVPGSDGPRRFDLATDLPLLDAAIQTIKDLRAIVIDALPLATGRDARRTTGTLFDQLAGMAQARDIAILTIVQTAGTDRGGHTVFFDALADGAARAGLLIEVDPADEKRRLLLQVKNELAPDAGTLAFRVTAHMMQQGQSAARVSFEPQYHSLSARQFRARQARGFNSAKAEATEFMRSLLGSARSIKISQVEHAARAAGLLRPNQALTQCRVLRDTRMAMGLMLMPQGCDSGEWVWAMPGAVPSQQLPAKQERSLAA